MISIKFFAYNKEGVGFFWVWHDCGDDVNVFPVSLAISDMFALDVKLRIMWQHVDKNGWEGNYRDFECFLNLKMQWTDLFLS